MKKRVWVFNLYHVVKFHLSERQPVIMLDDAQYWLKSQHQLFYQLIEESDQPSRELIQKLEEIMSSMRDGSEIKIYKYSKLVDPVLDEEKEQ